MKKKDLYALACIFCFAACSDPASDEIETVQNFFPVQFSVQLQKEILPFSPATRSMPPNAIPEPTVPDKNNGNKGLEDFCSYIEYLVYKEDAPSVPLKHRIYNVKTDPDFSIVYDTLQAGRYQICFLAHTSEEVSFANNIFSFDEMSDTFYNKQLLELSDSKDGTALYIDLQRIVSRIEFKAKDKVPDNIGKFEMIVDRHPNQFNILTGEGILSSSKSTFSYGFEEEEKGTTGKIHSFYTFIPSGDEKLSVTLTSTDSADEEMRSQTVNDIIPIANKIIRYTGTLYTPPRPDEFENTFQLNIYNNGEWDETEEKELQE